MGEKDLKTYINFEIEGKAIPAYLPLRQFTLRFIRKQISFGTISFFDGGKIHEIHS